MEYNNSNQWYMYELVNSLNKHQVKYTKTWKWIARTTQGEWVFFNYVWIRCKWAWSENATYGIPEVEWTIAEVLNGQDMSAKALREGNTVLGDNNDSSK